MDSCPIDLLKGGENLLLVAVIFGGLGATFDGAVVVDDAIARQIPNDNESACRVTSAMPSNAARQRVF
jgi:hypothetical protein